MDIHDTRPVCLHLDKIEVTFKAPYAISSIDTLVLDSFEGKVPATQVPLGECFTIEQREVRPRILWRRPQTITSVYGAV